MARRKVMGAQRGIHKRNLIYHLIYPYVRIFFFHYYGRVEIRGRENIPRGVPVIFAPNHQNALMDALIILFSAPGDVVFLARADIFNKRFLAFLLNSLKVLPVFRQRDGAAELVKNQEIFDISVNVLKNKHYLCVMPEGNHGHQRKLRTLVKGIFRIAFSAQEVAGSDRFVKIVPVGLDFGDYVKQHASLFINYGQPIEMSEYWEQYQENTARGINAVKADLAKELSPLMVDIQTDEYYEAVHGLREIFNDPMREMLGIKGRKLSDRFRADKEMIARLEALIAEEAEATMPDEEALADQGETPVSEKGTGGPGKMKNLVGKVERYMAGVKEQNIRDWVVRRKGYSFMHTLWRFLTLVVTFPIFLYGFITSIIPYWLPVRMVRNIKDRQFHSSVKAGLGILILFPLWYALMTLVVAIFTFHIAWWIWIVFLVPLMPLGKAALYWYFRWKKTLRGSWFRRQLRRKKPAALELVKLRAEIVENTRALVTPSG